MCYTAGMQRFLPYKGTAHFIHQAGKSTGTKWNIESTMVSLASDLKNAGQQTDCTTCFFEMFHYLLHHKVINLTQNLAERLMASKLSVTLENLRIPWGVFEVCVEEGFKIPGTEMQMPSCLVIAKLSDVDMEALRDLARRAGEMERRKISAERAERGLPPISPDNVFTEVDSFLTKMFSIKYRDPLTDPSVMGGGPMCHANFNFTEVEGKEIDEVIDTMPKLKSEGFITALDQQDKEIQKHILRLVMGLLCYINTKDPDVQPYKFHDRPKLGKNAPDAVIIGKRFDKAPPGYHLREPHFRHLRHERFQRDDKGAVKVIWVRAAEVGKGRDLAGDQRKEITLGEDGN